jgi:hypothetical protein
MDIRSDSSLWQVGAREGGREEQETQAWSPELPVVCVLSPSLALEPPPPKKHLVFFFFFAVLGFELRAYTLTP